LPSDRAAEDTLLASIEANVITRPLGNTGLPVSALGFGGGMLGALDSDRESDELLSAALDLGITFFDTARSYGSSEERIGRWLAAEPSRRARIALSTKTGYGVDGVPDWSAECLRRAIDDALRRLRTDVIDVMHLHSCPRAALDREEDVIVPLERARAAGKIRVVAYSGDNDALAHAGGSTRFGAIQCSVNVFDQRALDGAIVSAVTRGAGVVAKRALGNAPWRFRERPTGDYAEAYWERMSALAVDPGALADLTWPELAVRFAAFAPGVSTALIGTRRVTHLEANVRAVESGPLSSVIYGRVRAAFREHDRDWLGRT
jgi:aryl-alcohol dehydrogenase-like predicted oxidoreductase